MSEEFKSIVVKDGLEYCPHCEKHIGYTIDWIERNTVGVKPKKILKFKMVRIE